MQNSTIEQTFDRIRAQKKTAPAGNRGLTQTPIEEVRAMEQSIAQSEDKRKVAVEYLQLAARELDRVTQVRIHYVILARRYGLTNQQIGAALGVSEAAVRSLIARNGGDA